MGARLGAAVALLLCALALSADVPVPAYSARVVDQTGTLTGSAVARIEGKLAELEEQKGSQVAVLIVPSTQPEEIEQFGIRVADAWKSGRKAVEDGAILIVAKNDRRLRIEVGRGLEGAIPDLAANRIIEETITPRFKSGDFDGGVEAGVDQIIALVNGEALPEPDHRWEHASGGIGHLLPVMLVVTLVGSGVLRAMLGRFLGSLATGGIAGGLAWIISHLVPIGVGAGLLAFLFALLANGWSRGWTVGRGGRGSWGGFGGGGFGGGGFGGGSGGGGGFGGGGGGGFSGGGASGSW